MFAVRSRSPSTQLFAQVSKLQLCEQAPDVRLVAGCCSDRINLAIWQTTAMAELHLQRRSKMILDDISTSNSDPKLTTLQDSYSTEIPHKTILHFITTRPIKSAAIPSRRSLVPYTTSPAHPPYPVHPPP